MDASGVVVRRATRSLNSVGRQVRHGLQAKKNVRLVFAKYTSISRKFVRLGRKSGQGVPQKTVKKVVLPGPGTAQLRRPTSSEPTSSRRLRVITNHHSGHS